jgi:hypothetical protein
LGFVSIVFDTIILLQHYVLYPDTVTVIPDANDAMSTTEEEEDEVLTAEHTTTKRDEEEVISLVV